VDSSWHKLSDYIYKYKTQIWYLCTHEQVRNGDLDHIPNGYIQRLVAPDWQTGWKWLEDIFK